MSGVFPPSDSHQVWPLWPPGPPVELEGLYLEHDLKAESRTLARPLVYANYITSLDGRIALHGGGVPEALSNPLDWWLFQELAVQADALIVSGRYLRARAAGVSQDLFCAFTNPLYAVLRDWREAQGMAPWPWIVVASRNLECPLPSDVPSERLIFLGGGTISHSEQAERLRRAGAQVLVAGAGENVDAQRAVSLLAELGVETVYAVGGASLLHWLAADAVLSRLYLTRVHRLLGGNAFTSLVEGEVLVPQLDLALHRLYFEPASPGAGGQTFGCYQVNI